MCVYRQKTCIFFPSQNTHDNSGLKCGRKDTKTPFCVAKILTRRRTTSSALQYSNCFTVQYSTVLRSIVLGSTALNAVVPCCAVQGGKTQYGTALYPRPQEPTQKEIKVQSLFYNKGEIRLQKLDSKYDPDTEHHLLLMITFAPRQHFKSHPNKSFSTSGQRWIMTYGALLTSPRTYSNKYFSKISPLTTKKAWVNASSPIPSSVHICSFSPRTQHIDRQFADRGGKRNGYSYIVLRRVKTIDRASS